MRRQLSDYEDVPHPSATGRDDGESDVRRAFWRAFAFAQRHGCMAEFLGIYRPMARFAGLVAEADRRLAEQQQDVA